jgi:hypothetical protein
MLLNSTPSVCHHLKCYTNLCSLDLNLKLHDEEFHNFYSSPNIIIRMIKSRGMGWVGHVTCMEEMRNLFYVIVRKPWGKTT